jgi:transcriptional regulator with XRE-family HTH domain
MAIRFNVKEIKREGISLGKGIEGLPVDKEERAVSSKFAVMIKQARMKKGYSLAKLGEITNTSASYINRLEKYERRNPSISLFFLLAEALDIDIWDLLKVAIDKKEFETKPVEILLLQGNYSVKGNQPITIDARACLVDTVDMIVNKLDKNCDFKEMLQLGEMIRRFHEILKQDEGIREGA